MQNSIEDTIAAIATPAGSGALSIIRISGKNSFEIVDKVFLGKDKLRSAKSHTIHYGKINDLEKNTIDDVLVSIFRGPNSYTGEDSIEISAHGSQFIVKKIIETLLKFDIRSAEPGEFTKRAFLNGKIDLAQAEAVADVINSRTEASLRGARNQLDGMLSAKVSSLREDLISASSLLELELDFAEEDIEFVKNEEIIVRAEKLVIEISKLIDTYKFGRVIRDGVNLALVGKPNVGKSSLLNFLLKESRAIVSSTPGTTRDVIREELSIDGILFRIFDTAGIRRTDDEVEKEGVDRSRGAIKNADLIILLEDIESELNSDLMNELLELTTEEKIIRVINKIDLTDRRNFIADCLISALTGEGIDKLLYEIKKRAFESSSFSEETTVVSNVRHYNSLNNAKSTLSSAIESIKCGVSEEYISADFRVAESALGEIIGAVTSDDILNNIFENFCIGK